MHFLVSWDKTGFGGMAHPGESPFHQHQQGRSALERCIHHCHVPPFSPIPPVSRVWRSRPRPHMQTFK